VREQSEINFLNRSESSLEEAGLGSARLILESGSRHLVSERRAESLHRLATLADGRVPFLLQSRSGHKARAHGHKARAHRHRTRVHRHKTRAARWIDSQLRAFDLLAAAGVGVAERAACGWLVGSKGETTGFVVVLAPPGAVELDTDLRRTRSGRAESVKRAAPLLAGLHSRGVRLGRLYAWNVVVAPDRTLLFLDPGGARFARSDRPSAVNDLAALSATIDAPLLGATERRRFIEMYINAKGSPWERSPVRPLWVKVDRAERRLRRQGLFPRAVAVVDGGEGEGTLRVAEKWHPELAEAGFGRLADFVAPSGADVDCVRQRDGRRNFVVGAAPRRYFFKVHGPEAGGRQPSQGAREWENNMRLMRYGLPVAALAAWGENRESSFFASRDRGGVPLDDVLRRRPAHSGPCDGEVRDLARAAGRLVGAFHRAGFFHRDLYLCHILLEEGRLIFIDLQRLEEGYLFERRGQIKDLAALLYSSRDLPITETDRLRFLAAYLGGGRLRPSARGLVAAVRRKADRIARHDRGRRGGER